MAEELTEQGSQQSQWMLLQDLQMGIRGIVLTKDGFISKKEVI
jgi:hypothetical protein